MFFLIKLTVKITYVFLTSVIKSFIHLTNEAICITELMMWYVKVTTDYIKASTRQSTKYQQLQIPINRAVFSQPFPLPLMHTRSFLSVLLFVPLQYDVNQGTNPTEHWKGRPSLTEGNRNTCPCEQASIMWWICQDTIQDRNYDFPNSMVLQDIAQNCNKREQLKFLFS